MNASNCVRLTVLALMLALGQLGSHGQQVKGQVDVNTSDKSTDVNVSTSDQSAKSPDATAPQTGADTDLEKGRITTREEYNRTHHMGVTASNKASSLIGMEVRNAQHEKLGEIKDLVIDLPSGKVAYAVLGTGGFLGLGEKLIAIPPSAFTASTEEKTLVLNADKAKIEGAPSIPKTNWPDVHAQIWGAENNYWGASGTANLRSDTTVEGRSDIRTRSEHQSDLNKEATETDLNANPQENKGGIFRRQSGKYGANRETNATTFSGRITQIDPANRMMTVRSGNETKEFKIGEQSTISLDRQPNATPVDLKVGYHVQVNYHQDSDGQLVATSITKGQPAFSK